MIPYAVCLFCVKIGPELIFFLSWTHNQCSMLLLWWKFEKNLWWVHLVWRNFKSDLYWAHIISRDLQKGLKRDLSEINSAFFPKCKKCSKNDKYGVLYSDKIIIKMTSLNVIQICHLSLREFKKWDCYKNNEIISSYIFSCPNT